jgi:predicted secreted protein
MEGPLVNGFGPRRAAGATCALAALALVVWSAEPAWAREGSGPMRRADFSVACSAEIDNDRATAVLSVTDEDGDAARLATRVNETMAWALEAAGTAEAVRARSGGYQTWPIERDGRIRHWRSRQELILESEDLPALTELLGVLQARLELVSIAFTPSAERRREAEDRLITETLGAFRERAERVRESLGAGGWELVQVSVHTDGQPPVRPLYRDMARATAVAEAAPPALEAGTTRVVVQASGSIELLR